MKLITIFIIFFIGPFFCQENINRAGVIYSIYPDNMKVVYSKVGGQYQKNVDMNLYNVKTHGGSTQFAKLENNNPHFGSVPQKAIETAADTGCAKLYISRNDGFSASSSHLDIVLSYYTGVTKGSNSSITLQWGENSLVCFETKVTLNSKVIGTFNSSYSVKGVNIRLQLVGASYMLRTWNGLKSEDPSHSLKGNWTPKKGGKFTLEMHAAALNAGLSRTCLGLCIVNPTQTFEYMPFPLKQTKKILDSQVTSVAMSSPPYPTYHRRSGNFFKKFKEEVKRFTKKLENSFQKRQRKWSNSLKKRLPKYTYYRISLSNIDVQNISKFLESLKLPGWAKIGVLAKKKQIESANRNGGHNGVHIYGSLLHMNDPFLIVVPRPR